MRTSLTNNKRRAKILSRQAAGILAKIDQMIEVDTYCPEILQQVDAVAGLLRRMEKELLVGHLHHCVERRLSEKKTKTINELLKIFDLSKSA
jgi:DNA-binding FrmR family transcriptional regulator